MSESEVVHIVQDVKCVRASAPASWRSQDVAAVTTLRPPPATAGEPHSKNGEKGNVATFYNDLV